MDEIKAAGSTQSTTTESSDETNDAPSQIGRLSRTTRSSGRLLVGNQLRSWADVSRINYLEEPSESFNLISRQNSVRLRGLAIACKELGAVPSPSLLPDDIRKKTEDIMTEEFPHNVTPLMNENQLWGCFYNFPELYEDTYSPTVRILKLRDVTELVGGVLTKDMVAACLSYLRRTPILGDYVYIKLNLSAKQLINIDVLQHYKYLVYLDLSSNLLTDLSVLSNLLYLQFISVAFNRLETVLDYKTPQWFLTEVHYRYNSVKRIRDLTMFWSITILNLSHNNIKSISGLQNLRYLRHLDLSFNHIQRVENLNHLRLLWLDVSYNNISSFELGPNAGLWTLLDLEYLNLNENSLKSMKMFSGCTRLRELHLRNNRLSALLELAVYMRQMRRLCVLDLRANPICSAPGYEDVIFDTFPKLLYLDATELDPVYQRSSKMNTLPDVNTFACRRLLRMLYIEQLSRARVSVTPPADTEEVPLVVLVGEEAVGKGTLARRLADECNSKIILARLHTTATYHVPGHYIVVSQYKFDDMLLAGEFLSYSEMGGNSYGLSREEAFISDGKVRVCSMDLIGALMLKMRGRRPYLILAACHDKVALLQRQCLRKAVQNNEYERRLSTEPLHMQSTLQVLLSGRIIITGILNEILMNLPEEKGKSEFALDSECSLLMDSDVRKATRNYARAADLLSLLTFNSSNSSLSGKQSRKTSQMDHSLYSIYKRSQDSSSAATGSRIGTNMSCDDRKNEGKKRDEGSKPYSNAPKKTDGTDISGSGQKFGNNQYNRISATFKGYDSTKSSKSVTFTGPDIAGLVIEPETEEQKKDIKQTKSAFRASEVKSTFTCHYMNLPALPKRRPLFKKRRKKLNKVKTPGISISNRLPPPEPPTKMKAAYDSYPEDMDLWLAFLAETGVIQASESAQHDRVLRRDTKPDDPELIMLQLSFYSKTAAETVTTTLRDDYEGIHLLTPGLFHDTIAMDDFKEAFDKAKRIIRDIVNSQSSLGPMFDIDFGRNVYYYPTVEQRLEDIRKEIAPRQIFY